MRISLTLLLLAALTVFSGPAEAAGGSKSLFFEQPRQVQQLMPREPRNRISQSDGMTLSQAVESIRRRTGGEVVSAETRVQGGREVHYIRVLSKDGKVKTHRVNGRRR